MVKIFDGLKAWMFADNLKIPREIYTKVDYVKTNKIASYNLAKDRIIMNEKLFQNPKDPDGRYHDAILRHEYRHFLNKKNYIKHILIDLADSMNPRLQKANNILLSGKEGIKVFLHSFLPITFDRQKKVFEVSLTVTFLYILTLIVMLFTYLGR